MMKKRVIKLSESQIMQIGNLISEGCSIIMSDSGDDATNRSSDIEVNPSSHDGDIDINFNTTGDDLARIGVGNDRYRSTMIGKLGLAVR